MSRFETELKEAVDKFLNYPGKSATTAYPMALASLEYDLKVCLTNLDEIVESFTPEQQMIYRTCRNNQPQ